MMLVWVNPRPRKQMEKMIIYLVINEKSASDQLVKMSISMKVEDNHEDDIR